VFSSFGGVFIMLKKVLMFLVLGMLVAMSTTAMAQTKITWYPVDSDILNMANYNNSSFNPGGYWTDYVWYSSARDFQPVMSSGSVQMGCAYITGSADFQVTGGTIEFLNGQGTSARGLAVRSGTAEEPATINMTGGNIISDWLCVGARMWPGFEANNYDYAQVNIWGTADVLLRQNPAYDPNVFEYYGLVIEVGSEIDIRDDGQLTVPIGLQGTVDGYIASGNIVNGTGYGLVTEVVGDNYVVSAVPEPGTLLLLCLGLGSLALIRRK
jgi:hypothetical protein